MRAEAKMTKGKASSKLLNWSAVLVISRKVLKKRVLSPER